MKFFVIKITTVFALILFVSSCGKVVSEEDKVREVIKSTASEMMEKDIRGVMKHFSEDYKDDRGNDRKTIKSFIFMQVMRQGKISIFLRSMDVSIAEEGDKALAIVDVVLAEGISTENFSDILPDSSSGYRFTLLLDDNDGRWQINSATWENIGARALF